MHTILKFDWSLLLRCALLTAVVFAAPAATASEPSAKAADFLQFDDQNDGRCQNLSQGGKLTVMRNLHPSLKIEFRLIRYFVDVRQRGRATGTAEPGGEVIKIGCSQVGGRPQRWVVERATFIQEDKE